MIKKAIFANLGLFLALLMPLALLAAPKKKAGKNSSPEISCADVWCKKTKDFKGLQVKTFVLDIFETGTVMSDARAAVVPVETGDGNKRSGGIIFVVMPVGEFENFVQTFLPESEEAGSSFGGKMDFKPLSAAFEVVGGEFVLLYKIEADSLKKFSPSKIVEIQRRGKDAMKSEREGFTKRIFNVSGTSKKTAAELKRLVALYNQGKKKADKLTEKELKAQCLGDDEFSVSVFDEKAKTEWLLRR